MYLLWLCFLFSFYLRQSKHMNWKCRCNYVQTKKRIPLFCDHNHLFFLGHCWSPPKPTCYVGDLTVPLWKSCYWTIRMGCLGSYPFCSLFIEILCYNVVLLIIWLIFMVVRKCFAWNQVKESQLEKLWSTSTSRIFDWYHDLLFSTVHYISKYVRCFAALSLCFCELGLWFLFSFLCPAPWTSRRIDAWVLGCLGFRLLR